MEQNEYSDDMKNEVQKQKTERSSNVLEVRLGGLSRSEGGMWGGPPPSPLYNPRIVKIRKLQTNYLTRPWAAGPANFWEIFG